MRGTVKRSVFICVLAGLFAPAGMVFAQTSDKVPTNTYPQTAPTGQTTAPTRQTPPNNQPTSQPTPAPRQKDDRTLETVKTIFDIFSKERARQKAKKQAAPSAPAPAPPVATAPEPVPVAVPVPRPAPSVSKPVENPAYRPLPTNSKPTAMAAPTRVPPAPRTAPPVAPAPTQPPKVEINANSLIPETPVEDVATPAAIETAAVVEQRPTKGGINWLWVAIATLAAAVAATALRLFLFPKPKYAVDIDSDNAVSTMPNLTFAAPDSRFEVRFEWGAASIPAIKLEG